MHSHPSPFSSQVTLGEWKLFFSFSVLSLPLYGQIVFNSIAGMVILFPLSFFPLSFRPGSKHKLRHSFVFDTVNLCQQNSVSRKNCKRCCDIGSKSLLETLLRKRDCRFMTGLLLRLSFGYFKVLFTSEKKTNHQNYNFQAAGLFLTNN